MIALSLAVVPTPRAQAQSTLDATCTGKDPIHGFSLEISGRVLAGRRNDSSAHMIIDRSV